MQQTADFKTPYFISINDHSSQLSINATVKYFFNFFSPNASPVIQLRVPIGIKKTIS